MIFAQVSRCELHDITYHDDVIKWKHLPRYWPFVRGIHRSQAKGQWRGALMFTLICARINGWVNNREAGDLRRHRAHYGVTVMTYPTSYDTDQRLLIQSLQQCHKNHIDSVTIIGQFLVAERYYVGKSIIHLHSHLDKLLWWSKPLTHPTVP